MSRRKLAMHVYKSIIYRLRAGESARQIAKSGLAGRRKINEIKQIAKEKSWLNQEVELPDEASIAAVIDHESERIKEPTPRSHSLAKPHEEFIKAALAEGISASVIYQRLVELQGFTGSYYSVNRFAQKLKLSNVPAMTVPLNFNIAEAAQVDFGFGPKLYDERVGREVKTWFFVMTLCWSRHQYVELITHQDIETWLLCHQNAFIFFGGVVKKVIIDNAKCAITKACYYDPQVQRSYDDFAKDYGFIISACPPYDPQKKGRVEAGVKYVKKNFLPLREFRNLQDANQELMKWNQEVAGIRIHGSTFKKPLELFHQVEKDELKPLPQHLPEIASWHKVRLSRDCHVRFNYCNYSAPFDLYHKPLWLKATPTIVQIYHQHHCVATHARCFQKGEQKTLTEHLPAQARFYLKRNAPWCLEQSEKVGEHCFQVIQGFINHPTKDLLRQAQGVLSLLEKYSADALEQACQRAIIFQTCDYKTIAHILKNHSESLQPPEQCPDALMRKIYQGQASFQRDTEEFIH